MIRRLGYATAFAALLTCSAQAQEKKVEVFGLAGWTFSDGVSGASVRAGDGKIYDAIEPKDSFAWGGGLGYHVTSNWEIGLLYSRQMSKLAITGPDANRDVGDMGVKTYHGVFAYNMGESNAKARPFLFLGAGATNYDAVSYTRLNGQAAVTQSFSKFSPTFGLGIKAYPAKSAGIRLQARWTPTYIKSDPGGWWCDPYWGCYVVSDAQYSNQFELSGGITLRF